MGLFLSWNEWKIKESNARKRAVKAAVNGLGPALPGSYAACPSTNSRAMKSAKKTGLVQSDVMTERERVPDYSFDRWVKKTKEFVDDIEDMKSKAKEDEDDMDDKIKEIEKEKPESDEDELSPKDKAKVDKRKEDTWKLLDKKHREKVSEKERH